MSSFLSITFNLESEISVYICDCMNYFTGLSLRTFSDLKSRFASKIQVNNYDHIGDLFFK